MQWIDDAQWVDDFYDEMTTVIGKHIIESG